MKINSNMMFKMKYVSTLNTLINRRIILYWRDNKTQLFAVVKRYALNMKTERLKTKEWKEY